MKKNTVAQIQNLIRINVDSAKGLEQSAETIRSEPIARLFRRLADDRRQQMQELMTLVDMTDEEVHDYGSIKGAVHRWWLTVRGALKGGDDHDVLAEAERGEDEIKQRYEDALKVVGDPLIHQLLSKHYVEVARAHDAVRGMRDIASMN